MNTKPPCVSLHLNFRDHLVDRIPLDTPVVVLDLVCDSFGATVEFNLVTPRVFKAFLESEESVLDASTPVGYDYPGFGKPGYRVIVDLDNEHECSGHTFLTRPYLWCLATEVQPPLAAIDTYFGIEPFVGEDLDDLSFLEDEPGDTDE